MGHAKRKGVSEHAQDAQIQIHPSTRKVTSGHLRSIDIYIYIVSNDYSNDSECPCPKVIKLFSCSTQLSMKFPLLINMKMPTIVGIFIFISRENFILSYV